MRTAVRSRGSRLVFDLAGPYRSNIFALDAKGKFPDRLVVDVVGYVAGEKAPIRGSKAEELTSLWLKSATSLSLLIRPWWQRSRSVILRLD